MDKVITKMTKQPYASPSSELISLENGGFVCSSPVVTGNGINEWGNGGTENGNIYF